MEKILRFNVVSHQTSLNLILEILKNHRIHDLNVNVD